VTPYISGGTFSQRLQAGLLPVAEMRQLFTSLVQAVAYIHRRGVVHRDLKPSNILLDYDEASGRVYVRLIDFGIATKQGAEASLPLTTAGHEIGTIAYMAPERLNGIAAPSNDIYSLGVILYQMFTGRLPEREAFVSSSLPAPIEAVVRRCLAVDPGDRFASATDVLHSFEQVYQALDVHPSPTIVLPPPAIISLQPIDEESTLEVRKLQETGDRLTPQKNEEFGEADYIAPTIDIASAYVERGPGVNLQEKQISTANVADISVAVPGGKKIARRSRRRQKPLFVVTSLLIGVVLFVMVGLIFFAFPPGASASVNIGPQVHVLQQVYIITARPSQTSIDVATTSVPAYEKVDSITSSLRGQTGQQCNQFFFRCRQVVTPADIEYLHSQLRQALISQLSAEMDSQLQAFHATEIGTKQFTNLTESSNLAIGTVSSTVTVTLTEQGSVEYINDVDVQQLASLLLTQALGTNHILMNSSVQIGQPVVEGVADLGMVTMKVAAAGVEEYQWPTTQ